MDPAAFNPSEELKDDIIYNVETLLNLWLDHSGEEFHHTVEARLQQLISGLPWLLGSLPPIAQDFILKILHLHLLPLNYPVQQKIRRSVYLLPLGKRSGHATVTPQLGSKLLC